jgi:hypothetical protein
MLEIDLEFWGVPREMIQLRSQQARQNLLLQRVWLASTLGGKSTQVFFSNTSLPLALTEWVWVHNLHYWLIHKEDMWDKGTLGRGSKEIPLSNSHLKQAFFKIGHPVITGTYSAKKKKKISSPLFKDRNPARLSTYTT